MTRAIERTDGDAMNRSDEIRSTLAKAAGDASADGWAAIYRDHVAHLLEVLQSYGPSLQERLREQSRQLAQFAAQARAARRTIVAQRLAIGALVVLAIVLGAALRMPQAEADVQRPPIDRVAGEIALSDGWYCTAWEPTGEKCDGGCIWHRWCTACIPGCGWIEDRECRPSPGPSCASFAP